MSTARPDYELTVGDTFPTLRSQLLKAVQPVTDISGATVVLRRTKRNEDPPVNETFAMVIIDGPDAIVERVWVSGDNDTAGDYDLQVFVTLSGGDTFTVPNNGCDLMRINPPC